jgi:DNA adenine methylase
MKTIIRYAGGKSRAIKHITPFITDYDKIVSPFIGGGSLEVHWAGNLNKTVIGYDIFDQLVNFWQTLLSNPKGLSDEMKKIEPTMDEYDKIKEILFRTTNTQELLKNWSTDHYKRDNVISLDDLTLATYYYFSHNCSYGPSFLGWGSSVYLDPKKWDGMINNVINFKCPNLNVKLLPFEESIPQHKNDFLYLDPPYLLEKDSDNKMHKGMYPRKEIDVHHSGFNHEKLRDLLLEHEGDFVLSYNNCETIREFYKDFDFYYPEWTYSMGNGEKRIGKNRLLNGGKSTKDSHEILIIKKGVK